MPPRCRAAPLFGPAGNATVAVVTEELEMPARTEIAKRPASRLRGVRRWFQPPGLWVAVLGPDGSGKSSVIERYVTEIEPFFGGSAFFHLRPHLLGSTAAGRSPNTDPHGQIPRGTFLSSIKAVYLWADYVFGFLLRIYPRLADSKLVIFDRYYHDLLVDPRRFRYGGPRWLVRLIGRLIPLPDLMLILDAPAAVLQSRKQEVSAAESGRQSAAYRAVALSAAVRGRAILIDASLPLDEVVHECIDGTLALLARRTTNRLRID